jgi:hypothetical protein
MIAGIAIFVIFIGSLFGLAAMNDLNSVGESYTENYFRQLVVAIEATPIGSDVTGGVWLHRRF